MDNDDRPVGRILSRREALALFGTAGAALLAACVPGLRQAAETLAPAPTDPVPPATTLPPTPGATPAAAEALPNTGMLPTQGLPMCVARPEQTEGPYFVDARLDRTDIRSDPATGVAKEGVPLQLTFRVSSVSAGACTPLPGVIVDVWHCDALGVYSDVNEARGQLFLRGFQTTDANGLATFTTIYPGWYPGRTVHIHFKLRTDPDSAQGSEFTSQLYFDDATSDAVFSAAPYNQRGERSTRNERDGLFRNGGEQLLLPLSQTGEGWAGTFDIGLQLG